MSELSAVELNEVKSFPRLVELLRDRLGWPIGEDFGFEDIVYDYDAAELGLKPEQTAKIREIHQLRPLTTDQPWGVFFISFEDKKISVTVLRRMLRALVVKQRAGAQDPNRQAWQLGDLIFAANFGLSGERELAFVQFSDEGATGDLPVLKVLGWNAKDTKLHNEHVAGVLNNRLTWPDDPQDHATWRQNWSGAFETGHGEVIRTSKELAIRLAVLATDIRARANQLLAAESETGPMRTMLEAFRKNLIQDLDEDGFADMFAQTICYGMLAARISRPGALLVADNMADMVPKTNPFLKELFESFLKLGGRDKRKGMDFDELGVRDVVAMLNRAKMEAVLRDFGDRNPKEDPVIHFYELFLKEYDPKKRMQRGVFYTPRPVVNFIVRGVDEILREEFGLPLGLADTTTWGELAARNDKITVPDHVNPEQPFVQVLDPATGTGTFLVEAIDLIHKRMMEHWKKEGKREAEIAEAWNDYVPTHMLPRLTAFELMMAPYSIAHMKVGLKLSETGYKFGSDERARIFLTNALEPVRDLDLEERMRSLALAHEAEQANRAKEGLPVTVVIGNPPYSVKSFNMGKWITDLCEPYKENVRKEESQIQALSNDYIKFIRLGHVAIERSTCGIFSMITGHGYMLGTQPRDLRKTLFQTFNKLVTVNLNGSIRRDDVEGIDEPVFEIMTGVGIGIFSAIEPSDQCTSKYFSREGSFDEKMDWLLEMDIDKIPSEVAMPRKPNYYFWKSGDLEGEFQIHTDLPVAFGTGDRHSDKETYWSTGFATQQDEFAVAFDGREFGHRMEDLKASKSRKEISSIYRMCSTNQWNYERAKAFASTDEWAKKVSPVSYRPFDERFSIVSPNVMTILKETVQSNLEISNIAILTSRIVNDLNYAHIFATEKRTDKIFLSSKTSTNTYVFPLWLKPAAGEAHRRPNIDRKFAQTFSNAIDLTYEDGIPRGKQESLGAEFLHEKPEQLSLEKAAWDGRGDLAKTFGPRDLFNWIYAVLHAPSYRTRYAEFLKSDFPRIPTPGSLDLFKTLAPLGAELVALHLLKPDEAPVLEDPDIRYVGKPNPQIGKKRTSRGGFPQWENGKVTINENAWFEDVPKETFEFQVGGYTPLKKWIEDRAETGGKKAKEGRILTDEDILRYRRIVVALTETRRLMAEIDRVIDDHGGWPGAFYAPPPPPPTIADIVKADEGQELEYKSTFRIAIQGENAGNKDKFVLKASLKTVAAFLNSGGGILAIGIDDNKNVLGLKADLKEARESLDTFQQLIATMLNNHIGPEFAPTYEIRFHEHEQKQVCVIDVKERGPKPAYLDIDKGKEFFVRTSNKTERLTGDSIQTYIETHWS